MQIRRYNFTCKPLHATQCNQYIKFKSRQRISPKKREEREETGKEKEKREQGREKREPEKRKNEKERKKESEREQELVRESVCMWIRVSVC